MSDSDSISKGPKTIHFELDLFADMVSWGLRQTPNLNQSEVVNFAVKRLLGRTSEALDSVPVPKTADARKCPHCRSITYAGCEHTAFTVSPESVPETEQNSASPKSVIVSPSADLLAKLNRIATVLGRADEEFFRQLLDLKVELAEIKKPRKPKR